MGYFSNGTEGEDYVDRYCLKCQHWTGYDETMCAVWEAHLFHNGEGARVHSVLDLLIPRRGLVNEQCRLFVRTPE